MNLFEITTNNEVYAVLKGISLEVDADAAKLNEALNLLENLKSPSRNAAFRHAIEKSLGDLLSVAEDEFVDASDPDIAPLRAKAQRYYDALLARWNALPK